MSFIKVGKCVFLALVLVAIPTLYVLLYLSNNVAISAKLWTTLTAEESSTSIRTKYSTNVTYDLEEGFPLPDAQHPCVKMSSLRYLSQLERGKDAAYIANLRSHGDLDSQDRTIVLRYRSNTSTILAPRPDAGRISTIFMGRTGNKMFIYASLYGIARRNGMLPVISENNPLLKLFHLNVTVVQSDRPGRDWVQYVPKRDKYDQHIKNLDPRVDVEIVGILTSCEISSKTTSSSAKPSIKKRITFCDVR